VANTLISTDANYLGKKNGRLPGRGSKSNTRDRSKSSSSDNKVVVIHMCRICTSQSVAETQIMMLTKQMAALTMQMTKLTKEWNQEKARNRARSRSRSQQRFRPRSRIPRRDGVCYYHWRFGQETERCTQLCTFKKENE